MRWFPIGSESPATGEPSCSCSSGPRAGASPGSQFRSDRIASTKPASYVSRPVREIGEKHGQAGAGCEFCFALDASTRRLSPTSARCRAWLDTMASCQTGSSTAPVDERCAARYDARCPDRSACWVSRAPAGRATLARDALPVERRHRLGAGASGGARCRNPNPHGLPFLVWASGSLHGGGRCLGVLSSWNAQRRFLSDRRATGQILSLLGVQIGVDCSS